MRIGALGKLYEPGQYVIRQGERGDCMYIVQQGQLEVLIETANGPKHLDVLRAGDVFGEMALFTRQPRSATVRALGPARVLTIDKRGFLKRVHEDPTLAFRILRNMSDRIQRLNAQVASGEV